MAKLRRSVLELTRIVDKTYSSLNKICDHYLNIIKSLSKLNSNVNLKLPKGQFKIL